MAINWPVHPPHPHQPERYSCPWPQVSRDDTTAGFRLATPKQYTPAWHDIRSWCEHSSPDCAPQGCLGWKKRKTVRRSLLKIFPINSLTIDMHIDSCHSRLLYSIVGQTLVRSPHLSTRDLHPKMSLSFSQHFYSATGMHSTPGNDREWHSCGIASDLKRRTQAKSNISTGVWWHGGGIWGRFEWVGHMRSFVTDK